MGVQFMLTLPQFSYSPFTFRNMEIRGGAITAPLGAIYTHLFSAYKLEKSWYLGGLYLIKVFVFLCVFMYALPVLLFTSSSDSNSW